MERNQLASGAYGALLGLAMGDAIGFPAMYHRGLNAEWTRSLLWKFSAQADENRINKFALPFSLTQEEEAFNLCGTDDTEYAVVSALILSETAGIPDLRQLEQGWNRHVRDHADSIWSGISERASIDNALKGLTAPATGNDNPHHFDDGAVARAVPVGIRFHGRPDIASRVAGDMASITNAEDGVFAAQAMAASIAVAMNGASPKETVEAGLDYVPGDSWTGRKIRQAITIAENAGSAMEAIPLWNNLVVNHIYNFGNIAPETLAVSYGILLSADGDFNQCMQLAAMVPKQADSMPAMVGALVGAINGSSAVPSSWIALLDELKGICVPHTKGLSLRNIAERLLTGGEL
ncbi:ADP-ribosylglycohydrolase family protein [Cohnella herbarum]|uniref:ADP-ribosylglycohydrolase family protein n=1 Tax=Cohnella herbarum TaxID=2728023 RepID=A0A7Z2VGE5_9BACL|nr:ADP-ribosylglycohydrolase family protein [Cohnella herbarum]QJD82728.1 hypothetical protein HH215_05730 [Cohnella herbarum]